MVTEYEQLLQQMCEEKRAKLEELRGMKGKEKDVTTVIGDLKFIEGELYRYQQGMSLFRTRAPPKVGRWGQPETEAHGEEEH